MIIKDILLVLKKLFNIEIQTTWLSVNKVAIRLLTLAMFKVIYLAFFSRYYWSMKSEVVPSALPFLGGCTKCVARTIHACMKNYTWRPMMIAGVLLLDWLTSQAVGCTDHITWDIWLSGWWQLTLNSWSSMISLCSLSFEKKYFGLLLC